MVRPISLKEGRVIHHAGYTYERGDDGIYRDNDGFVLDKTIVTELLSDDSGNDFSGEDDYS